MMTAPGFIIFKSFALTSREIMADLMYPAPVEAPKARRGRR